MQKNSKAAVLTDLLGVVGIALRPVFTAVGGSAEAAGWFPV